MKFTVSSSTLLHRIQVIGKVIAAKNQMAILEYFLLDVKGNNLTITASDLETTISTTITIDNGDGDVTIALPSKLLSESLKEFGDQPLVFDINPENLAVELKTETGRFNFIGQNSEEFPEEPALGEEILTATVKTGTLATGISKTIFATAVDDGRPMMTGIFFKFENESITFVATDAHKLVRLVNTATTNDMEASFILPKKSASLLKNILGGLNDEAKISFDDKNIVFEMEGYRMVCRQINGKYPNYNSVIPTNNPYEIIIDRQSFANAIKRIIPFANQASQLIKLTIESGSITLLAQDIDFSNAAQEKISCQFEGETINIGFKATLLADILSNFSSDEVRLQLADPSRAGIILPSENEENEDLLMLLMPMLIND